MTNGTNTALRDKRIREYMPVKRIVWNNGVQNAESWIGSREIQVFAPEFAPCAVLGQGSGIVLDFGMELHGGIRIINLGGKQTGRIRLRFGESVSEAMGEPDQMHAIHDSCLDVPVHGTLEYGNTAFRFVRIDNEGGELRFINVLAVSLMHDVEFAGAFESSDPRLNAIWKTAVRTVHLNMQEFIFDGAKRDRMVWLGDMHPEARCILGTFRDSSIIRDSLQFQMSRIPSFSDKIRQISSYTSWCMMTIADYYRESGDLDFIMRNLGYIEEAARQYCTFVDADGREMLPPRRFLDWPNDGNEKAVHAGLQGVTRLGLLAMAEILDVAGRDTGKIRATADRMLHHVPDCGSCKSAAAVQTLAGLADRRDVLTRDPISNLSAFFGYYILLAQPTANALELIRSYWGAMLDLGATSFWEEFDVKWGENAFRIDELPVPGKADVHADFGDHCYVGLRRSLCHGWACGPAPFLSERLLGVRALAPGKYRVRPDAAGLEFVRGRYPVPGGVIEVETGKGLKTEIAAPGNIEIVE